VRRLVLIQPYPADHVGEEDVSVIVQMPLNLAYLVALTPREQWQVEIIDETQEPALDQRGNLTFGHADLVGLTGLTYQAPRMYEIAAACRETGIPVVAGGAHATVFPNEVARHVDSVVVGEVETIWATILEDAQAGALKRQYNVGPLPLEILGRTTPDRPFLREKYGYKYSGIITTRGCPFQCDFCCVPKIQGRRYRERPPEDVWRELEGTDYKGLMLAEDNFYGYTEKAQRRARKLFKGWADRDLGKNWFGFTSLDVTQDRLALEYMARSGCLGFLIGVESLDRSTLRQMHKGVNLGIAKRAGVSLREAYRQCFANVHKQGMIVWGSLIFGSDFDTDDTFKQVVECAVESGMDVTTFGIYTPMSGTASFARLAKENRIFRNNFPSDWFYYNSGHLVYQLRSMPLEKFIKGLTYVYENLFSPTRLRERFRESVSRTNNVKSAAFAYRINLDWRLVFGANLRELQKLLDSGIYPHLPATSRVQVPASLLPGRLRDTEAEAG